MWAVPKSDDPPVIKGDLKKRSLLAAGLFLLFAYSVIFGSFFPNRQGYIGHDYAYYLPSLLDGYFWYKINGPWEIPWFTPSFCGGSMNWISINDGYYAIPQVLVFFIDPLRAVRIAFLGFAGVGFFSCYLLLRRVFLISQAVSFLGAALFLFNGFYSHRMLIGHLFVHSYMLLPLLGFFLLRPLPKADGAPWRHLFFDAAVGGILFAYMVLSGLSSLIPPVVIAIMLAGMMHGLQFGRQRTFWLRLCGAGIAGILLSFSKLVAILHLMKSFPRSGYPLPGFDGPFQSLFLAARALFFSPSLDPHRGDRLINFQWYLDRHEWEYSVTFIPLALIFFCGWVFFRQEGIQAFAIRMRRMRWLTVVGMGVLLLAPVAVNTYSPGWNAFLKDLPVLKNSSSLIRWFIVYIPIVTIGTALALEKTNISPELKRGIVAMGIAAVVSLNALTERDFYHSQRYSPDEVIASYGNVEAGEYRPEITRIGVYLDAQGRAIQPLYRNNLLVYGASQAYCYEPLFGYRLESFPVKTLHPGPALMERGGLFNIKNPACYVWPEANACRPGDHFTSEQKKAAELFLSFRPFPFQISALQRIANRINGLCWIAIGIFFLLNGLRCMTALRRKKDT